MAAVPHTSSLNGAEGRSSLTSSVRRDQGTSLRLPLCRHQARHRRHRPLAGQRAGPAPHQGEHGPSDRGQHPDAPGLGGLDPLISDDPELGGLFKNTLSVATVEPADVSEAVLFLASDESRYVTGLEFTIDAGATIR